MKKKKQNHALINSMILPPLVRYAIINRVKKVISP